MEAPIYPTTSERGPGRAGRKRKTGMHGAQAPISRIYYLSIDSDQVKLVLTFNAPPEYK